MATNKPTITEEEVWARGSTPAQKARPAQTMIDRGWSFGEVPPFQVFNWFKNLYSKMFVHIQENGVPGWSADIGYQERALTMHAGQIWYALSANTNKEPGNTTAWKVAQFMTEPLPIGSIIPFKGAVADIPAGWVISTEFNDRFMIGTSTPAQLLTQGGSADTIIPKHNHTGSISGAGAHSHSANHNHTAAAKTAGEHVHGIYLYRDACPQHNGNHTVSRIGMTSHSEYITPAGAHSHEIVVYEKKMSTSTVAGHTHAMTVTESGQDSSGKNLPPFKRILFIERIA